VLSVAQLATVTLSALVLLNLDLWPMRRTDHLGHHRRSDDQGRADARLPFAGNEHDLIKNHALFILSGLAIDSDSVSARYLELRTAIPNDCVHVLFTPERARDSASHSTNVKGYGFRRFWRGYVFVLFLLGFKRHRH
jgi:hypothetical protein